MIMFFLGKKKPKCMIRGGNNCSKDSLDWFDKLKYIDILLEDD